MSIGEERSGGPGDAVKSPDSRDQGEAPQQMIARVLLIDDNETILASLQEFLGAHGFSVRAANDPVHALRLMEHEAPDIIVCDVVMPGIDGFQFHEEIRSKPEWCAIPFIFLSAIGSQENIRYAKSLGCDDYLPKPFEPLDLISVLRGKLRTRSHRRDASDELLERYRRKIVNTLSHEFRTPLVAINTGAEILLDQIDTITPANARRLVESIQRGGIRLQRLVEDFMTLQQIDSGAAADAAERSRRRVSLLRLAETAIENFIEITKDGIPQIHLSSSFVDGEPLIHVHEIQIISAIQRLLSNAFKFSGRNHTIEVSVRASKAQSTLAVRDYGPGLPPERMAAACGLFEQIDRERQEQQGCGLGLTISRYFTELNGGKLLFRQPPDGLGLVVELNFPRVQ